jgi:hypothetical protein
MPPSEWASSDEILKKVKLCDLIEIKREVICHWVLYAGDGYCIHVTSDTKGLASFDTEGVKHIQLLKDVVGNDQCRINNLEEEARSRNLKPKSDKECLEAAIKGLDIKNPTKTCKYKILSKNCEYHVTKWKFGKGFTVQVS